MTVNLHGGIDTLVLANVTNTGSLSNVENVTGDAAADTITMLTTIAARRHQSRRRDGRIDAGRWHQLPDGLQHREDADWRHRSRPRDAGTTLTGMTLDLGAGLDTSDAGQCR